MILIEWTIGIIAKIIVGEDNSESLGISLYPFKVIEETPPIVPSDVDSISVNGSEELAGVIGEVLHSEIVVELLLRGFGRPRPTVFSYDDLRVIVAILHPV